MAQPSTSGIVQDSALCGTVDGSHVVWLAAANQQSGVPGALLSRFHMVQAARPRAEHMGAVLAGLRLEEARLTSTPVEALPLSCPDELAALRKMLGQPGSLRAVKRLYESMAAERALHGAEPDLPSALH